MQRSVEVPFIRRGNIRVCLLSADSDDRRSESFDLVPADRVGEPLVVVLVLEPDRFSMRLERELGEARNGG